ncbi:MAG: type II secretion system protein [Candidatus Pacebacteria bacterium]|nr:type II secretion system protein [Candidatus Paceibacterota bacterium]MBP9715905.1 type II secretion system protein [Candidatus Paceibacterota bacterium]
MTNCELLITNKGKNHIATKNKMGGFTLIELMVSMSIFMIVMIMALGALVNISNVAKKSRALHQAMDNVNFAMESMTRSLRTGSNYDCGSTDLSTQDTDDCPSGEDSISFISQNKGSTSNKDVAYELSNNGSLQKCVLNSFNSKECISMTSSNVKIENLQFYVTGSDPILDQIQPSVYISMKGSVSVGSEKTEFALQTFVSQRNSE